MIGTDLSYTPSAELESKPAGDERLYFESYNGLSVDVSQL